MRLLRRPTIIPIDKKITMAMATMVTPTRGPNAMPSSDETEMVASPAASSTAMNLVTEMEGVDSTVKPDGMREAAASAEARDGARFDFAASAAAFLEDSMVMARLTDAAVTSRDTRLSATPAAFAKLVTIASCTSAV